MLKKPGEAAYYEVLREETLKSFQEEYYTSRGRIVSETQTGCVLSLQFGLAKEKDRETITKALVTNIENHVLFMREDLPSWLYAVNKGATTLWERWDAILPDGTMQDPGLNSMNHYANGAIGDWMYRKIGGINQIEAGYHRFYIRPMFVQGIEETQTELESPYGKIVSCWSCRKGKICVEVQIPANTTAVLYADTGKHDSSPVPAGKGRGAGAWLGTLLL